MPIPTAEIACNFVGSFKVGDNLGYNAGVLCELVEQNGDGRFNKPVVLQIGAILEAALSQIIFRAQRYNREGVPNIAEDDRQEIEGKKIDKFALIIDVLRKYNVLDGVAPEIYDDLHRLRKYRNKVHIQESINIPNVSVDEHIAFSNEICLWAVDLNLAVLTFLSENLARPDHIQRHVRPFQVPCR